MGSKVSAYKAEKETEKAAATQEILVAKAQIDISNAALIAAGKPTKPPVTSFTVPATPPETKPPGTTTTTTRGSTTTTTTRGSTTTTTTGSTTTTTTGSTTT